MKRTACCPLLRLYLYHVWSEMTLNGCAGRTFARPLQGALSCSEEFAEPLPGRRRAIPAPSGPGRWLAAEPAAVERVLASVTRVWRQSRPLRHRKPAILTESRSSKMAFTNGLYLPVLRPPCFDCFEAVPNTPSSAFTSASSADSRAACLGMT